MDCKVEIVAYFPDLIRAQIPNGDGGRVLPGPSNQDHFVVFHANNPVSFSELSYQSL